MTSTIPSTPSLAEFRKRAAAALVQWNLPDQEPELLNYRENAVFKVRLPDGNPAVLRLHRPGYQTQASLFSELQWISYLAAHGISVPPSIKTAEGRLVVQLQDDNTAPPQFADLIGWIDGQQIGEGGKPLVYETDDLRRLYHSLGTTMGRVHRLTDAWEQPDGFERPAWDVEGLLGEAPFWGRFWDCPGLTALESQALGALRQILRARLYELAPTLDYGLVHADLLRENVLVTQDALCLIDFNDCGAGFRLYELATCLVQNIREERYPIIERALIDGYLTERPQAREDLAHLPLFMLIRSLTYIGWMSERIAMPGAPQRLQQFIDRSLEMARVQIPSWNY